MAGGIGPNPRLGLSGLLPVASLTAVIQVPPYGGAQVPPYGGAQVPPYGGAQVPPYGGAQVPPYGGALV
ncbi:unnamed protein product [marine sediment metagenome]|uniref:Uncharacterized protein n=1 Tax=marine sediment metagenome TaxID=412755 RepID=X0UV83_9ZZZZ